MTPAYLLPPLADQYAAFLRGVAAAPDCDTPRLVIADWLEEKADTVRAEFIRVQCELAAFEYYESCLETCTPPDFEGCPMRDLRKRELALFDRAWLPKCPGVTRQWWMGRIPAEWQSTANLGLALRRGFVDTVRGPLAAMLGGECGRCGGNRRGPDEFAGGTFWPTDCPDCHGTGRTPGALGRMGPELLAVRRVEATDCEPWVNLDRTHWGWWERTDYHEDDGSLLDRELMLAMADDPARGDWNIGVRFTEDSPPGGFILFRTEAAARDALSRAVLAVARRRAGLEQPKRRN